MTTAIIGTGGIGSAIVASACCRWRDPPALERRQGVGPNAGRGNRASGRRRARQPEPFGGADAVVLAARFSVLKEVIDEIADALGDTSLVVPSNPVGLGAQGKVVRLLPEGQSSGQVVAGWLPIGTRFAIAFGIMSANRLESSSHRSPEPAVLFYVSEDEHRSDEVEHLIRTAGIGPMDRRCRTVEPTRGGRRSPRSCGWLRRGAVPRP
jgi:8-hydroxy-5-deazaflavin:NADPH oxidoreductase